MGAAMNARVHDEPAGSAPSVLCIHSFSSSAAQYQGLTQRLGPRFDVLAGELYGHGNSPAWPRDQPFTLADEAARLQALLPDDAPVHLVGHSYGAAVALRIAASIRTRLRSMTLYEPAIWGTLSQSRPHDAATREIEAVRDETIRLIDSDQLEAATERFIDYWAGPGTWAGVAEARRPRLVATVRSLRAAWIATFEERWSADALRALDVPCLLLSGTGSTAAARCAVDLLHDALPDADVIRFDGIGHLGPLTHADTVDAAIAHHLLYLIGSLP
jgi:pimeloyl-ACP methyl ester carboxylesterase